MTYASEQAKIFGKKPIWLYKITIGAGTPQRFTSRGSDYISTTPESATWTSTAIGHSPLRRTSAAGRAELVLTFPQSNSFAQQVRDLLSPDEVEIIVYHKYLGDPDDEYVTKFRGRVVSVRPLWGTISLVCENRFTRRRQRGVHRVMQRPCPFPLYGYGCNLAIASFETSATATDITGLTVTFDESPAQADGYYSGGVLTYSGERQLILAHSGTSLILMGPVEGLEDAIAAASPSGVTVTLAPGCDRTRTTCNDKFSNILNFGGFWAMSDTPYDGRNLF